MKNFLQYLSESQKVYEFKVKVANTDPSEYMAKLKVTLEAYAVESVSATKRLPIMENNIDFPAIKNAEVHVFEVALKYPVMATQLRELVAEGLRVSLSEVFVVPCNHPEELWRNNEGELREYVQGDDVLTKPFPDATAEQTAASKQYAEAGSILKDLKTPSKFEIAGDDKTVGGDADPAYGKTLQQVATGDVSPVGSKQNKIPNATKGLA